MYSRDGWHNAMGGSVSAVLPSASCVNTQQLLRCSVEQLSLMLDNSNMPGFQQLKEVLCYGNQYFSLQRLLPVLSQARVAFLFCSDNGIHFQYAIFYVTVCNGIHLKRK